jgi:hypothetical protein
MSSKRYQPDTIFVCLWYVTVRRRSTVFSSVAMRVPGPFRKEDIIIRPAVASEVLCVFLFILKS